MNLKNYTIAVEMRHKMHRYPELSNREENTIKLITEYIESHTDFKVINRGNYIYVDYRVNDREYVAFRADIDAIPMKEELDIPYQSVYEGVSHKCGHDGHSATMLAFILEVYDKKPDKNILFIFQHAEETGDGAKVCVELFDQYRVSNIYAYHNMSNIDYKSIGVLYNTAHLGSYGMEIQLIGKESHASEPERGVNPAYLISDIVLHLDKLTKGAICSVVHMEVGKNAYGVSAGKGVLRVTIRSDKNEVLDKVKSDIVKYVNEKAKKNRVEVQYRYADYFPATINHKKSVDNIISASKRCGFDIDYLESPYRASEDFGVYLNQSQGAIFFIGNGKDYPSIHTHDYDFRDELITIGADMFMELLYVE